MVRPVIPTRDTPPTARPPLQGVRVIDFTRMLAGPFATQILGDLGAEVIKIERPGTGDDTRAVGASPELGGESAFYLALNRSKSSVAIDLKSPRGREVVLDLIGAADVLVENFTGIVMRRYGLDYPSLRERFPDLIYCSISAYGRTGANADAAGFDSPLTAEAGALWPNADAGGAPVSGAIPYTDTTTALNAAIGILAALRAREHDGMGQHVDVAMFDSALANLSFRGIEYLATGVESPLPPRQQAGPRGLFETADGEIAITCGNDRMFAELSVEVFERPDWLADERFATSSARRRHAEAFLTDFRAEVRRHPSAYWSQRCKRVRIPCGEVRTPGAALVSEEAAERGLVFGLPHPAAGVAPVIAQPFVLSETPCHYGTPPLLGQHTETVLAELLGYDRDRIAELVDSGAIGLDRSAKQ